MHGSLFVLPAEMQSRTLRLKHCLGPPGSPLAVLELVVEGRFDAFPPAVPEVLEADTLQCSSRHLAQTLSYLSITLYEAAASTHLVHTLMIEAFLAG